jgi:hypothetical protein
MVMDVQEYAKQKGIPVGAIPIQAFREAQTMDKLSIRKMEHSKAEVFKTLCFDTKQLVENCIRQNKVSVKSENSRYPPKRIIQGFACYCYSLVIE